MKNFFDKNKTLISIAINIINIVSFLAVFVLVSYVIYREKVLKLYFIENISSAGYAVAVWLFDLFKLATVVFVIALVTILINVFYTFGKRGDLKELKARATARKKARAAAKIAKLKEIVGEGEKKESVEDNENPETDA
jgi:ABC-type multidrug transport system fused ATPase/permease subunit